MDLSIEDPERAKEKALDPEKAKLISRIRLRPLQCTHRLAHRPEVGRIRGLQRTHGVTHGQARIRVPKDRTTTLMEDLRQKQDLRLYRQRWTGVRNRCLRRMHLQENNQTIQMRPYKECTLISPSCTLERMGLQPDLTQSI